MRTFRSSPAIPLTSPFKANQPPPTGSLISIEEPPSKAAIQSTNPAMVLIDAPGSVDSERPMVTHESYSNAGKAPKKPGFTSPPVNTLATGV